MRGTNNMNIPFTLKAEAIFFVRIIPPCNMDSFNLNKGITWRFLNNFTRHDKIEHELKEKRQM
jgi:hypothetical protein